MDFLKLAQPGIAGLSPYQPGKPIEALERELGITGIVKLASNENPLGASPKVADALARQLDQMARYPDGSAFLLKNRLQQLTGFAPDRITIGNGSNDVLELLGRLFLGAGTEALVSQHAFVVYPQVILASGARLVEIPASDYGHDLEASLAAINDRTRMVFIANPNNPTGAWVAERDLLAFLDEVPESVIVVLDEAYFEYARGRAGYPDGLKLLDRYPNLAVTRTLSKAYGLAGLRLGYAITNPVIADLLNRIRQPFNVNAMSLAAALIALDDQAHVAASVRLNDEGMVWLERELAALGLATLPSAGNFLAVDFSDIGRDALPIYEALLRRGVIVRPIGVYGLPNHLRVTIGTQEENALFVKALAEALQEVGA